MAKKKVSKIVEDVISATSNQITSKNVEFDFAPLIDSILAKLNTIEKKLERLEIIESHLLDILLPQRKGYLK